MAIFYIKITTVNTFAPSRSWRHDRQDHVGMKIGFAANAREGNILAVLPAKPILFML